MTPRIALESLTVGYTRRGRVTTVARDLTASLDEGSFTILLGENGAGKSTALRTIAGLQPPLAGLVRLDGIPVHSIPPRERARRLGVVLTEQIKAWGLTARDLVALGRHPHLDWTGRLSDRDHAAIDRAMALTRTVGFMPRPVAELSDGERQRVMIARALAQEPRALILDEVTAFLDLPRRIEIALMLRDLARQTRCALLLSTHDLDLAIRTADRVWLLGSGGLLSTGTPEALVLGGAFDRAFQGEGLDFDRLSGTFRVRHQRGDQIGVRGHGVEGVWTHRALERLGFDVCPGEAALGLSTYVECEPNHWMLVRDRNPVVYPTLDALLAALLDHPLS